MTLNNILAVAPQFISGFITLGVVSGFCYISFLLPGWIKKLRTWRKYCASHSKFSIEAGQGHYLWLEDPWSSMCRFHPYPSIRRSRAILRSSEWKRDTHVGYLLTSISHLRSSELLALPSRGHQACIQPGSHVSKDKLPPSSKSPIPDHCSNKSFKVLKQTTAPVLTGSTMLAGKFQRWIQSIEQR